jgi:RNA polymerase sigma-70 factor (ECF subfamily)
MSQPAIFETELMPYLDDAYSFAFYLTGNEQDAQDLAQEAFLKAYHAMHHYKPGSNGKAWIFKILKNTFINQYRRKAKKPIATDFSLPTPAEVMPNSAADLRTEIFDQLMGDEITAALHTLPEDFRITILLCDVENFSYEEIAEILEIPIGTVRSRIHRARKILKNQLSHYARQQGFSTGM